MILKNIEIINLLEAITKLVESDNPLSIKTLYRLNKNIKKMNELKEVIENQKSNIIIEAKDRGIVTIEPDGHIQICSNDEKEVQKFIDDLNELYSVDNELDLELFDIDELGDTKLSGNTKMAILRIIKEN